MSRFNTSMSWVGFERIGVGVLRVFSRGKVITALLCRMFKAFVFDSKVCIRDMGQRESIASFSDK